MSDELNEELLEETPEEIDSTSPAEPSVEPPTVMNPGVSTGSWLFAAVSTAFLVAIVVVSILIPTVESAMDSRDSQSYDIWGTNIYKTEGCGECHSRFVRKADSGYGSPATLATLSEIGIDMGTSRIGGDLQNISGKYTFHELVSRFENPGTLQPGTVMPSYKHLDGLETVALINYLQAPIDTFDRWGTLRNTNGIEMSVPDQILSELVEYFDPDSGEFFSPVPLSTSLAVIGSGIYSSRCASCHNSDNLGVLDTDIYLYWKISDGVPGSEMPSWRGTISKTGIWYTIAYMRSMQTGRRIKNAARIPKTAPAIRKRIVKRKYTRVVSWVMSLNDQFPPSTLCTQTSRTFLDEIKTYLIHLVECKNHCVRNANVSERAGTFA